MKKENTIKALELLANNSHKEPKGTHAFAQDFYQCERVTAKQLVDAGQLLTRLMKLALVANTGKGWYLLRYGREEIQKNENTKAATIRAGKRV